MHIRSLSDGERAILSQDSYEEAFDDVRILKSRELVARKMHTCDTCVMGWIAPGERYTQIVTIEDGQFKVSRYCSTMQPGTRPTACGRDEEAMRVREKAYASTSFTQDPLQYESSPDELPF